MPKSLTLAYARLSSKEQSEGQTLEQQVERLRVAGFDALFVDLESGRYGDRVQFTKMLELAKSSAKEGHAVTIRVARGDRFARNAVLALTTIEELEAAGVAVESLDRGRMSLATVSDWMVTVQEAVFAELWSRQHAANLSKGWNHKRLHNQPVGGRAPWGYQLNEGCTAYEPDPEIWEQARALIERFLEGDSFREVAKFSAQHCGKKWSISGLKWWLDTPTLRGHTAYTVGGWTQAEKRRGDNPKAKEKELRYNTHPALLTDSEYQQIRRRLDDNTHRKGPTRKGFIYAVSTTYCYCSLCGHKLFATGRQQYRYLSCRWVHCNASGTVRDEAVEAVLELELQQRAGSLVEMTQQEQDQTESAEVRALKTQIEQLRKMRQDTGLVALVDAISEAEARLAQLTARPPEISSGLRELILTLEHPGVWEVMQPAEKRKVFLDLVDRVEVRGREIEAVKLRV